MPEGDTIHTLVRAMRPKLEGEVLEHVRLRDEPAVRLDGRRVERLRAVGKHMFMDLDGGESLRSHLGMHGSWHRYPHGATWKKPERHASLVLTTRAESFVCFHAGELELMKTDGLRARDLARRLGPDLCVEGVDLEVILDRVEQFVAGETPMMDLLLDQRVACGIGNVYKSEVLFVRRLAPTCAVSSVDRGTLREVYACAAELMQRNVFGGRRVTRATQDGRGSLWVYERAGRPCFRCGAGIRHARAGHGHRDTYWCARCQPA